ncbi:hypothetical protein ACWDKQ_23600 [Saccharopolyspora sp. NPDC000995]
MNATEADRAVKLAELLTNAAVALKDLSNAVLFGRATDEDLLDGEQLLSELVDTIRDQCKSYVPPRVIDGDRTGR